MFKIDSNGSIQEVKARAPHPKLEEEAIRVINLIPYLKPATFKGKPVTVAYSLPIKFKIN
jgi:protein TonB